MNGNRYLIDTNIAIYLLNGDKRIAELLNGNHIYISFITELELYSFKNLKKTEIKILDDFISACTVIDINRVIKDYSIELRKKYNLRLPDCIIAATAQYLAVPLFTADADFKILKDLSIIKYEPGNDV